MQCNRVFGWNIYVKRGGCQYEIENFFEFNLRKEIEDCFNFLLEPEAIAENEE